MSLSPTPASRYLALIVATVLCWVFGQSATLGASASASDHPDAGIFVAVDEGGKTGPAFVPLKSQLAGFCFDGSPLAAGDLNCHAYAAGGRCAGEVGAPHLRGSVELRL